MRKLPVLAAVLVALGSLCTLAILTTRPSAASQEAPLLRIKAGLGQGVISANEYLGDPAITGGNTVRVAEGTTVVWTLGSDETHTVTFRAGAPWPPVIMTQPEDPSRPPMYNPQLVFPTVPSGPWDGTTFIHMELQSPDDELRVSFARAGNYRYSCLFHEEMDGYVEVVVPGTAGITMQAAVDQHASTHWDTDHAADVAQLMASRNRPSRIAAPGGASTWFVRSGTSEGRHGQVDLQAFLPDSLTVAQGDTVVWYVDNVAPHTVTFPPTDGSEPEFVALQLPDGTLVPPPPPGEAPSPEILAALQDPANAPRLVFVGGLPTQPSPTYDGRSFYNSGFIGEHPLVQYPTERAWALTFDAPGVYQYVCLLHEELGMNGIITVVAR